MEEVTLSWIETNYDELQAMEETDFYVLSEGSRFSYFGIAYLQNIEHEAKQTIRAFELDPEKLTIWLGYIIATNVGRITEELVRDIECLLIYTHQPSLNTQCKSSYTGRDNLEIQNRGCILLKSYVKIEKGIIYLNRQ